MSFFGNLFHSKITYTPYFKKDKNYPELIHVFGADRVMPEDGDSFDIWEHRVINMADFSVTKGIKQRGNDFDIKSGFAKRALEDMAKKMNRNLAFDKSKTDEEDDDSDYSSDSEEENDSDYSFDSEDETEETEYEAPVKNQFRVEERESGDSDTAVLPKLPKDGIVITMIKSSERERFSVELFRHGQSIKSHLMKGMGDYFRHEIYYPEKNQIVMTCRKENWLGSGGMGFYVLNTETGEMVFDGFI